MTLQELATIGGIVSSVAVVVSLVYLALQVRINTMQLRSAGQLARLALQENFVAAQQESLMRVAENPELYRVWRVASANPDSMSDEDRERFGMLIYGQMYRYYMMYQAHSVEPLERGRGVLQIDRLAGMPAFQAWWTRQRRFFDFDPGFITIVEERIALTRKDK